MSQQPTIIWSEAALRGWFAEFTRRRDHVANGCSSHQRQTRTNNLLALIREQWRRATLELMSRIDCDHAAVGALLAPGRPAPRALTALHAGLSEPHGHGRSVAVLELEGAGKLVYKPRDLAVVSWFFALVTRLKPVLPLPLHTRAVLLREGYGWEQHVEARDCESHSQIARYYERIGCYLRLFEVLRGTDLHDENVLACADHPVILDLETALGADAPPSSRHVAAERRVWERRRESVLAVGLLPEWQLGPDHARDHSGLSITPRLCTPAAAPVERRSFLPQILAGYRQTAEALKEADLDLAAAKRLPIRYVARPTSVYIRLLHDSLAQDDRAAFLRERLGSGPLVAAERAALLRLDVPLFITSLDAGQLREVGGGEPIELPLGERLAAIEAHRHRTPTPALIESALASGPLPAWPEPEPADVPSTSQLLAAARALGEQIVLAAVDGAGPGLSWLGLVELPRARTRTLRRLNADLHCGTTGIALTLARLAAVSGDARFAAVARRALQPTLRALADTSADGSVEELGPGAGPASWRYATRECARLLSAPELLAHLPVVEPVSPPERPLPSRADALAALARAAISGRYLPESFGAEQHNLSSRFGLCGLIERFLELYQELSAPPASPD